ncbi:hypothetical protein MTP99_019403 [Tenebrio molitor]|jgi:hypothetical protein|nr:hypothetical protein MTP99_019403 [Tenebrio molitor]
MSSTNFYIGLPEHGGRKNGSETRGQTHDNIFGAAEPAKPTPKKNIPASTIKNIFVEKIDNEKPVVKTQELKGDKTDNGNETAQIGDRVRVPPGGFSTRLW